MENKAYEYFKSINEYYAMGLFENPSDSWQCRFGRAERRYWEERPLHEYNGGKLYPCGFKHPNNPAVQPAHWCTVYVNWGMLDDEGKKYMQTLPSHSYISPPHTVGGNAFTHSIPNYGRVAEEGLDSYLERVMKSDNADFRQTESDVIEGVRVFHRRALEYLKSVNADSELIAALEKVPFRPAETLYEALVCWNFVFYMDNCDDPGRLDNDLYRWYNGEDITDIIREFYKNVDRNGAWTAALGPDYNELTRQCLRASFGMRRPSLELRVKEDMPEDIWDLAEESIKFGGGNPSLYNETLYQKTFREFFPEYAPEDLKRFCGGGCTESMLAGISCVGSLDAGINFGWLLRKQMEATLAEDASFEEFYSHFLESCRTDITKVMGEISAMQKSRAENRAHPMRTLLIDDCIDRSLDYWNGGARCRWSVVNFAGLVNLFDAMLAIRELVYIRKEYTGRELIEKLDTDDSELLMKLKTCPSYGNNNGEADAFAAELTNTLIDMLDTERPWHGGRFLASSIQFATYVGAGYGYGATPDGREADGPLCDSLAAIHGNDKNGCLDMLTSIAKLPLSRMLGTPVVNLKLAKSHVDGNLRSLAKAFFKMGGMQLQINCRSREELIEADKDPDAYPSLCVRIGGYSEYFKNLSHEYRQTVIDRTEF